MKKLLLTAVLSAICVFPVVNSASAHDFGYQKKYSHQKQYNGPAHHKRPQYNNAYKQGYRQASYDFNRSRVSYSHRAPQAFRSGYQQGLNDAKRKYDFDHRARKAQYRGHHNDDISDVIERIVYLLTAR